MAKTRNPLFSLTAAGAIGRVITFNNRPGRPVAKRWHQPTGAPSAAQTTRREKYKAAALDWHALTPAEKLAWKETGALTSITGYNAFISAALLAPAPPAGIPWDSGSSVWDGGASIWIE